MFSTDPRSFQPFRPWAPARPRRAATTGGGPPSTRPADAARLGTASQVASLVGGLIPAHVSSATPPLGALVTAVDAALARWQPGSPGAGPDGGALLRLVAVDDGGGGTPCGAPASGSVDVGLLGLGDRHPLDLLLGFVAPPDWVALGVAVPGRGHDVARRGRPEPLHVTLLLARSGESASVLRCGEQVSHATEPPEGAVADACRRALGLPTARPPATTAPLWARWWLDRVVRAAIERPPGAPAPDWPAVASLHPATFLPPATTPSGPRTSQAPPNAPAPADLAASTGPGATVEPGDLAARARALEAAWGWSALRSRPGVVDVPGAATVAALGDWMDDGMAARWLLGSFPPVDDLLDACRCALRNDLATRIEAVVAATAPERATDEADR